MKTFTWCRQELAEWCGIESPHAHVCITTPGGRVIKPGCGRRTLNMEFHDLDPEAIKRTRAAHGNWPKAQEMIDNCFTEAHANALVAFLEPLEAQLVVNCEAGISRSPAVVLALRRKYGGDTEEVFREAIPNIHVASVLGRVLGVGPFQPKPPKSDPETDQLFG